MIYYWDEILGIDPLMENLDLADLAATPMHPAGDYNDEQWHEPPDEQQ